MLAHAVGEGWTVEELEEHIHEIEHDLCLDAIQLLAEGCVTVRANGMVAIS